MRKTSLRRTVSRTSTLTSPSGNRSTTAALTETPIARATASVSFRFAFPQKMESSSAILQPPVARHTLTEGVVRTGLAGCKRRAASIGSLDGKSQAPKVEIAFCSIAGNDADAFANPGPDQHRENRPIIREADDRLGPFVARHVRGRGFLLRSVRGGMG